MTNVRTEKHEKLLMGNESDNEASVLRNREMEKLKKKYCLVNCVTALSIVSYTSYKMYWFGVACLGHTK